MQHRVTCTNVFSQEIEHTYNRILCNCEGKWNHGIFRKVGVAEDLYGKRDKLHVFSHMQELNLKLNMHESGGLTQDRRD